MKLTYVTIAVLFIVVESGEQQLPLDLIDKFHFFRVNLLINELPSLRERVFDIGLRLIVYSITYHCLHSGYRSLSSVLQLCKSHWPVVFTGSVQHKSSEFYMRCS